MITAGDIIFLIEKEIFHENLSIELEKTQELLKNKTVEAETLNRELNKATTRLAETDILVGKYRTEKLKADASVVALEKKIQQIKETHIEKKVLDETLKELRAFFSEIRKHSEDPDQRSHYERFLNVLNKIC
jgi:CHASE3 domain sensor protein